MKFIPHFCVVLNAVIWGLVWIPMQWLDSKGLSVIWATFFSYLALSGLLLFARPSLLLNTLQSKTLLLMGIAYGLTNICFNWAVTNGDVVRVVFLFYLMPIWAAIFAKIFLSEDLGYKGWIRIFLALTGLMIVLNVFDQLSIELKINFYEIVAIFGGVFFALGNVFLRKAHSFSSFERSFSIFLGSCVVPFMLLTISFLFSESTFFTDPFENLKNLMYLNFSSILGILFLMILILGTANFCLQYGGSKILVQTTTLLMLLEIPVATISLAFVTNKLTEKSVFIGGGLIVITAIWASFDQNRIK